MATKPTDTKPAFEIPGEMRDFADRSVEQARKAVDGLMGAAHKAASTAESSAKMVQENVMGLASKAMNHAQTNISAAFDLAQSMARAKSPEEVMKLQGEFLKAQMSNLQAQAKDMGEVVQNVVKQATKT